MNLQVAVAVDPSPHVFQLLRSSTSVGSSLRVRIIGDDSLTAGCIAGSGNHFSQLAGEPVSLATG